MKTQKVTKVIIGILAGLLLLSFSAAARAELSPNLLVNDDFPSSSSIGSVPPGALSHGIWYSSGSDHRWSLEHAGHPANYYASLGSNRTRDLFQAVQVSRAWPGHTATAGPAVISFDYQSHNINTASTYAKLYGSNSQPTYTGTYTGLGTWLGDLTGFSASQSSWTNKSLSFDALAGYAWYTLVITGSTSKHEGSYFRVDNVNVQVTPIPAAVWLLGSGLIGLAVLRRRTKT
jgi:hypothetical protein